MRRMILTCAGAAALITATVFAAPLAQAMTIAAPAGVGQGGCGRKYHTRCGLYLSRRLAVATMLVDPRLRLLSAVCVLSALRVLPPRVRTLCVLPMALSTFVVVTREQGATARNRTALTCTSAVT